MASKCGLSVEQCGPTQKLTRTCFNAHIFKHTDEYTEGSRDPISGTSGIEMYIPIQHGSVQLHDNTILSAELTAITTAQTAYDKIRNKKDKLLIIKDTISALTAIQNNSFIYASYMQHTRQGDKLIQINIEAKRRWALAYTGVPGIKR